MIFSEYGRGGAGAGPQVGLAAGNAHEYESRFEYASFILEWFTRVVFNTNTDLLIIWFISLNYYLPKLVFLSKSFLFPSLPSFAILPPSLGKRYFAIYLSLSWYTISIELVYRRTAKSY